jgi:hypothetical protein
MKRKLCARSNCDLIGGMLIYRYVLGPSEKTHENL